MTYGQIDYSFDYKQLQNRQNQYLVQESVVEYYNILDIMNHRAIKAAFSTIKIKLPEVKTFKLDGHNIPTETTTTKEETLQYIRQMEIMRRMEIASDQLYKNRQIRGFCHLYDGQQAIAEGMEAGITFDDLLIGAYRVHCQAYKRGYTVRQIIAEMLGKKTGATFGKGGSMHFYSKQKNFYGGNGIVGAQMPVGTGLAFALKYQKKPNVCVTMFGDGAANQGQLFEAANMAKLWNLPVIYFCENNKFGMGTSVQRSSANPNFYSRGDVIPGIQFNGNNVWLVREVMKWAKNYALEKGPLFLEAITYRYHGHSMSDPGLTYRTRDQVQEVRQKEDPISLAKRTLLENNLVSEEQIKTLEKQVIAHVKKQVQTAQNDPFPTESDLLTHAYANSQQHFIRGKLFEESQFAPEPQSKY